MPIAQCSRSRVSSLIYALLIALLLTGLVALLLRNVYIESNKASWHRQLGTFAQFVDDRVARLDSVLLRLAGSRDLCGDEAFKLQRNALIDNPYVVDIFFLSADAKRLCGSRLQQQQTFDPALFQPQEGVQMTRVEPSSTSASPVFYLYRALPSGGYVVAMVPAKIFSVVLSQSQLPALNGYLALVTSRDGEPLHVESRLAQPPLVHSPLFTPSLQHYVSRQLDGHWVQAMPLLNSPTVSLVYVASLLHIGLLPTAWVWSLLGGLLLMWGGLYWCHGWWGRFDADPGRTLRAALKREEFFNVYQPIRDGSNGRLLGFEVLMRWRSSQGIIGPLHFIPMAEEQGVLVAMTRRQIDQACRALAPLLAHQSALKVSFNISSQHLLDPAFLRDSALWKLQIPHLVYEITEGSMVNLDDEVIGDALQRLRSLGIRLAVDDFGTGYSSLAYLQRLPLDILKADRCFVAALGSDSINAPILEAIVKLAHKLGLEIIAEGVEEATQEQWLLRHGVVQQQGWLHGKPLTIGEGELLWHSELGVDPSQDAVIPAYQP